MIAPIDFAKSLASRAGDIMRTNFLKGVQADWKGDNTPVTAADLSINALVLEEVQNKFPTHSFIGEEGSNLKESESVWVCDPIDGTIPFSSGYPTFAFSLALVERGTPVVGVIYDPILDRLAEAERGGGTKINGVRTSVSTEQTLSNRSMVSWHISKPSSTKDALVKNLTERQCRMPKFYSTVYAGLLVSMGTLTAEIYGSTKPWDAAAVKIIVEEAGGKVTDLDGNDQRYDGTIKGFVASNGIVHDELIQAMK